MVHSWAGSSIRMTEGCTSIAPTPKWNAWTIPPRFRERLSYEGSFWSPNASGSKRSAHADVSARARTLAPRRCLPTRAAFNVVRSFRSLPLEGGRLGWGFESLRTCEAQSPPSPPPYWHRGWSGAYNPRSMSGVRMPTATQTASPQVHAVQPSSPDHCILLSGVRWETYESLLADMQDSHAAHFAYDRGVVEIMARRNFRPRIWPLRRCCQNSDSASVGWVVAHLTGTEVGLAGRAIGSCIPL